MKSITYPPPHNPRVEVQHFATTGEEAEVKSVLKHGKELQDYINKGNDSISNPDHMNLIDEIEDALNDYLKAFAVMAMLIKEHCPAKFGSPEML